MDDPKYRFAQEKNVLRGELPTVLLSRSGAVHEKSACALSVETPRFKRATRTLTLDRFILTVASDRICQYLAYLPAVLDGHDFRGHEAAPSNYIRVEDKFWSTGNLYIDNPIARDSHLGPIRVLNRAHRLLASMAFRRCNVMSTESWRDMMY